MRGIQLGRIVSGKKHDPVVYFVRINGAAKIGWSTRLLKRLGSMYLCLDDVLLLLPGGAEIETRMHTRFDQYRISDSYRRELFQIKGELAIFLAVSEDEKDEYTKPAIHKLVSTGDIHFDPGADLLTLAEALVTGVLDGTLDSVRQARKRDAKHDQFVPLAGFKGQEHAYRRADLAEWNTSRNPAYRKRRVTNG